MSLRVDLTGNGTGFSQMLDRAKTQAKSFANSVTHEVGSSWAGIGKMAAGWFAGFASFEGVKRGLEWFVQTGDQIKDTAEQIDMSADSWQRWADAVERAGLSTGGFMRIVEALRQKRTDAMTDPKARGQLSRLGFSDAEITGDMDMDTFLVRALSNAKGGEEQRKYLADIIGARGLKYSAALGELPNASALFDADDLKQADDLEKLGKDISKAGGRAVIWLKNFFSFNQKARRAGNELAYFAAGVMGNIIGRGWLWDRGASPIAEAIDEAEKTSDRQDYFTNGYKPVKALSQQERAARYTLGVVQKEFNARAKAVGIESKDPMDAMLAKQREDMALNEQQRKQRLLDSERGLMTIGDRRTSIRGEMVELQKQIATRNAKMKGEDFLSSADKQSLEGVTGKAREFQVNQLRQKYQEITDELQLRVNRGQGDLKQKPLKFDADTMSKAGLYSASAVAYNPLLNLQQKTNQILNEIKQEIRRGRPNPMGDSSLP